VCVVCSEYYASVSRRRRRVSEVPSLMDMHGQDSDNDIPSQREVLLNRTVDYVHRNGIKLCYICILMAYSMELS